jgi:hypothetical protein
MRFKQRLLHSTLDRHNFSRIPTLPGLILVLMKGAKVLARYDFFRMLRADRFIASTNPRFVFSDLPITEKSPLTTAQTKLRRVTTTTNNHIQRSAFMLFFQPGNTFQARAFAGIVNPVLCAAFTVRTIELSGNRVASEMLRHLRISLPRCTCAVGVGKSHQTPISAACAVSNQTCGTPLLRHKPAFVITDFAIPHPLDRNMQGFYTAS